MNEGMAWNGVDYVFLGLVLIGTLRGLVRGLSKELMILVSLGIMVWASGRWYGEVSAVLQRGGQLSPQSCDIVAYALLLVALFLALLLLRLIFKPFVKLAFSKPVERIGGAAIGGVEAALTGAAALIALSLIPDEGLHNAVTKESRVGSRLTAAFPKVYDRMAERLNLPPIEALKPAEDAAGATNEAAKGAARDAGRDAKKGADAGKGPEAERDAGPPGGDRDGAGAAPSPAPEAEEAAPGEAAPGNGGTAP